MTYFWLIVFSLLFTYSGIIIVFSVSWKRLKLFKLPAKTSNSLPYISVIIALRNEDENLANIINALNKQTISSSSFEVVFINDHSTDMTYKTLKSFSNKHTWLKYFELSKKYTGKKEALQLGIAKARGELLAFTDGDCIPGKDWLKSLSEFYLVENKPDFIIGMVDLIADTWLKKIFRLEFLSLVLSSAGAAILKHPILCNGANMAVKSSALKTYKHNASIASGDDVFLLHYIKKQGGQIKVLKSSQNLILTKAPNSISSFFEQRKRWASKTKYYNDFDTISIALLVFITNLALSFSILLSIYMSKYTLVLLVFCIKAITDLFLFWQGNDLYKYKSQLWRIPIITIIYPFYISLTSLTAIKKPFTWKGRRYSK